MKNLKKSILSLIVLVSAAPFAHADFIKHQTPPKSLSAIIKKCDESVKKIDGNVGCPGVAQVQVTAEVGGSDVFDIVSDELGYSAVESDSQNAIRILEKSMVAELKEAQPHLTKREILATEYIKNSLHALSKVILNAERAGHKIWIEEDSDQCAGMEQVVFIHIEDTNQILILLHGRY